MGNQKGANNVRMRDGDHNYVQQMQNATNYQTTVMAAQLIANNQHAQRGRRGPTQTIWNDGHMVIDDKTYLKSNAMIYNSPGSEMVVEKTSHHHNHHNNHHHHNRHHHRHQNPHEQPYVSCQGPCNYGCSNLYYILDTNNGYSAIGGTSPLLIDNGPSNEIVQYQPTYATTPRTSGALVYQPVTSGYTSSSSGSSSQATILADRYAPRQTDPRCHCNHRNHCTCLHRIETRSHERLLLPASPLQSAAIVPGRLGLESCRRCFRRAELFSGGYCGECQVDRGIAIEVGRREHRNTIRYYDDDRGRSRSRGIRKLVKKEVVWD